MNKLSLLLAAAVLTLTACSQKGGDALPGAAGEGTVPAPDRPVTYAVEAGSAGEEAALALGFATVAVDSQARALMEVQAGTADAAVIDALMAGAMVGPGTSYPNLTVTDQRLTEEFYGVGCRKGSDLAAYINAVLYEAQEDGTLPETAERYGVQAALTELGRSDYPPVAQGGDVAYIQEKGTLVVGITEFAPMDYPDEAGEWIGFDADLARLAAQKLGVTPEFVVINWDNKVFELEARAIDVVWNGMTLTDAMLSAMTCTAPYCSNAQVVVRR